MTVEQTIFEMLTENTGRALCDSGDYYGRNWETNQGKTLEDFQNSPEVVFDADNAEDSTDICFSVSVFHYLTGILELDDFCHEFNEINTGADNWDSELAGGLSSEGELYLRQKNADIEEPWNTYNGEENLSQTLQGANVEIFEDKYVLLQIHGGCDIRGGYTDARLFKFADCEEFINPCPMVYGNIDETPVDNGYSYNLTDEGEAVPVNENSEIYLNLSC